MWSIVEILPSAARTALANAAFRADNAKAVRIVIKVTLDPGTASITPSIQALDQDESTVLETILTGAAITGTGTVVLEIAPQITAVANLKAISTIPPYLNFHMAVADTQSMTYSVEVWIKS